MSVTKESFLKRVAEHKMTILQDNGVYRHLYFEYQNTGICSFQLTTFPNHLVISGDCGTYVFNRLHDMFEFFRRDEVEINEGYWAEKVEAYDKHREVRAFSPQKTEECLKEKFEEWVARQGFDKETEQNAREEFESETLSKCEDEITLTQLANSVDQLACGFWLNDAITCIKYDFTPGFRWCLYAIVWGIQQYDAAKKG